MPEFSAFETTYPMITQWIERHGWIELGKAEYSESLVRAFNQSGMVWENLDSYPSLDRALAGLEEGLASWLDINE